MDAWVALAGVLVGFLGSSLESRRRTKAERERLEMEIRRDGERLLADAILRSLGQVIAFSTDEAVKLQMGHAPTLDALRALYLGLAAIGDSAIGTAVADLDEHLRAAIQAAKPEMIGRMNGKALEGAFRDKQAAVATAVRNHFRSFQLTRSPGR